MQSRRLSKNESGVTLIEALVSMVVFSIGIMGMAAMQSQTQSKINDQHQRNIAIWKGQELVERMKANNSDDALGQYVTSINSASLCNSEPAQICAETYKAGSEVGAAQCSETQMATFDSWQIICDGDDSLENELSNPTLAISCATSATPPCLMTEDLILTISWETTEAAVDPRLSEKTTIARSEGGDAIEIDAIDSYFRQVFRP